MARAVRVRVGAALSVALVAGGLTFGGAAPAEADVTAGLLLQYELDEFTGTVATDSSGNNHNGTVYGTVSWGGQQGLAFNGTNTYVKMPNNIMAGLTSITVAFDVWIDPALSPYYMLYGMGNTSGANGNGYLFTTGSQFRTAITQSNYTVEQNTDPAGVYELNRGLWKHVAYTQTGNTGVLYENGVEKARSTAITITPGSIGGGTTLANYIGRSLYSADKYFKGRMRDFRLYNRALAANEVAEVANRREIEWEQLKALADNNGALATVHAVKDQSIGGNDADMVFPADYPADKFCNGCLVAPAGWKSEFGITPNEWPRPWMMTRSQFTEQQISDIEDAIEAAVQPTSDTLIQDTTYKLTYFYDAEQDRIVAQTDAPASVTDPLKTDYPNKVVVQAQSDPLTIDKCTDTTRTNGVVSALFPQLANETADARTELQWQQVQALRDYNCALAAYEDPTVGPVLIFPSDRTDLTVTNPPNWKSEFGQTAMEWPVPATKKSAQFTVAQIAEIQGAIIRQLSPTAAAEGAASYPVSYYYDGRSDRIVVATNAPASATNPLLTAYPSKITITPTTPGE